MAGIGDLKIQIVGTLNPASTVTEINRVIKQIEKDPSLQKLNINIGVTDAQINNIVKQIASIQDKLKGTNKPISIIDPEQESVMKSALTTFDQVVAKYKELGSVKISQDQINPLTNQLEKFSLTVTKGTGEVEKLKYELASLQGLVVEGQQSQLFVPTKISSVDNTQAIYERQDQQVQAINSRIDQQNAKEKEVTQQLENQISLYQRQAELQATNLTNSNKVLTTDQQSSLQNYLNSVRELNTETPQVQQRMRELALDFREISTQATTASKVSSNFWDTFKSAFTIMPLFSLINTAITSPISAMKDMIQQLIQIDTQMTEIKRVMDAPDYQYTQMLQDAVNMSGQLSSKLTDVLSIMGDFGRMGFSAGQLNDITKTAQVLQNISDLNASDSVNALTSAMLNFNIASKDSMTIADKLNEVDNHYAITTKDLADSIRKAAATAKTFGVSLDELNGYTAAIGSTTRETGDVIGNGLKSIFSRITTAKPAIDALQSIGVSVRNSSGDMKNVDQILGEVASKWYSLSKAQQENVGVSVASRYQLTRFLALMNNWQMATDATTTSINSQGSSMKEQQKYADSLQARINRLSDAWSQFTLSMGKAFLTNGIVDTVESLNGLASGASTVINKVGALGIILGTLGTVTAGVNDKFRLFTQAMIFGTGSLSAEQLALTGISEGMTRAEAATAGFTMSLRGLASATLIGAIFTVAGIALEKLINYFADAKKAQEDYQQQQQKGIDALTTNKDQTDQLISQYETLSEVKKRSNIQEDQYLQVQQKLADIYPQLVSYIDGTGQAHLKSKDAIDQEIQSTNQLIEAKKLEQQVNAKKDIQGAIDTKNSIQDNINQTKDQLKSPVTIVENGKASIAVQKSQDDIKMLQSQLLMYQSQWSNASQVVTSKVLTIANSYSKLQIDSQITQSVQDFFSRIDTSKLNSSQLEVFAMQIGKVQDALQKAYQDGDQTGFDKAKNSLVDIAKQMGASQYTISKLKMSYDDFKKAQDAATKASYAGKDGLDGVDTSAASLDGTLSDLNSTAKDTPSVLEQIVGITQKQVDSNKDLITQYQLLNNMTNRTAEQDAALADAKGKLSAMYPQFIKDGALNVEQMRKEAEAEDILLKAVTDVANGHANAEEMMTLNMAMQSKNRLKMISDQIEAYEKMMEAAYAAAEADGGEMTGARANIINSTPQKIADLKSQVDALTNSYSSQIQHLSDLTGYQGQYYDSTTKSNSATQNTIYVTDKYKQSMDELNAAISEYSSFQNKYTKDSESYRGVLQKEIDLLTQKEQLLVNQAVDLHHQIDSGNIAQTGMITTGGSSSGGSVASSGKQYTGKYASYINQAAAQYGLDPLLVAAVIQQESGFQAGVVSGAGAIGLMQLMPATARSLGVSNAYDPYQNIMGGVKYLADQIKTFGGNVQYALAAYNAGPGAVQRYGGIPPYQETQNYVASIMANYTRMGGGSGSASVLSTSSGGNASKIAADKAQAIDQAKSELLNLNQDLVSTRNQIEQLQAEIVQSKIDQVANSYNNRISDLDQSIKNSQASMQNFVEYSAKWQFENDKQINLQKQKIQANIDEENALKNLLKTMSLTADQQAKLSDQIKQLDANTYQYQNDLYNLNFAYYTAQVDMFDKKVSDLNNTIKSAQSTMSLYSDSMDVQNTQTRKVVDALNQEIATTQQEIKTIQYAISTTYISEQQKAQLQQKIADLTQAELDYQNQIKQTNDQLLQWYTNYYNKKAEIDKKALDDEYTAYQNAANKKLALVDKTENQATYQSGLQQKQKAIKDLQNQINAFMLDPTQKGKVADLQKQLAQNQTELSDYIHQHDIQNQKDAINADVTAKKDSIDKQKTQVDTYYNNLIQFQTQYQTTSENLANAHLENVKGFMAKFAGYIQNLFVDVGKSMDINMLNKFNNLLNVLNANGGLGKINPLLFIKTAASVKSFDTGGYTGNGEGLAYLHEKEIILNKDDSSNFLQAVDISRQFATMMSKLSKVTNLPAQNGISINMPITIQNLNGTKDGVNDFFSIVNSRLRSKGGLTLA